jgi:plastocyanin
MRKTAAVAALSVGSLVLSLAACDSPASTTAPRSAMGSTSLHAAVPRTQPVEMLDDCDPATFNAVIGPGTCQKNHPGLTFSKFIQQLIDNQNAPAWRNAPSSLTLTLGSTLSAINRGGEVHTFTRVAAFGGGVVPDLNAILGLSPRPECLNAAPDEFLPPGGVDNETANTPGTKYYQCCIHPWMRTTVVVR